MYKNNSLNTGKRRRLHTLQNEARKNPNYLKPNSVKSRTTNMDMDKDDTSIHTDISDLEISSDDSGLWLNDPYAKIILIHINNRQMMYFRTTISGQKISILWDTGASKSVIGYSCVEKPHTIPSPLVMHRIHLSSTSKGKIVPIG